MCSSYSWLSVHSAFTCLVQQTPFECRSSPETLASHPTAPDFLGNVTEQQTRLISPQPPFLHADLPHCSTVVLWFSAVNVQLDKPMLHTGEFWTVHLNLLPW